METRKTDVTTEVEDASGDEEVKNNANVLETGAIDGSVEEDVPKVRKKHVAKGEGYKRKRSWCNYCQTYLPQLTRHKCPFGEGLQDDAKNPSVHNPVRYLTKQQATVTQINTDRMRDYLTSQLYFDPDNAFGFPQYQYFHRSEVLQLLRNFGHYATSAEPGTFNARLPEWIPDAALARPCAPGGPSRTQAHSHARTRADAPLHASTPEKDPAPDGDDADTSSASVGDTLNQPRTTRTRADAPLHASTPEKVPAPAGDDALKLTPLRAHGHRTTRTQADGPLLASTPDDPALPLIPIPNYEFWKDNTSGDTTEGVSHLEVSDRDLINLYHRPRSASQRAAIPALTDITDQEDSYCFYDATIIGNMDVSVDLGSRCDSPRRQLFRDENTTSKRQRASTDDDERNVSRTLQKRAKTSDAEPIHDKGKGKGKRTRYRYDTESGLTIKPDRPSLEVIGEIESDHDDSDRDPDFVPHPADASKLDASGLTSPNPTPAKKAKGTSKGPSHKKSPKGTTRKKPVPYRYTNPIKMKAQKEGLYLGKDLINEHIDGVFKLANETRGFKVGQAKQIKSKVQTILHFGAVLDNLPEGTCDIWTISQDVIDHVMAKVTKTGSAPSTVKKWYIAIEMWLKYLGQIPDVEGDGNELHQARDRKLHQLLTYVKNHIKGASKKCDQALRKQKTTDPNRFAPEPPHVISKVIGVAEPHVRKLLKGMLQSKHLPRQTDWVYINRFICAYSGLYQLQRPGICINMLFGEVMAAQATQRGNELFHIIRLSEHKSSGSYIGILALDENMWKLFLDYAVIRARIIASKQPDTVIPQFLVCGLGTSFEQVGQGIAEIQKHHGLKRYTTTQARRAGQTHMQNLPKADQDIVSRYIAHSTEMANRVYRAADMDNMCKSACIIADMNKASRENHHLPNSLVTLPEQQPGSSKQDQQQPGSSKQDQQQPGPSDQDEPSGMQKLVAFGKRVGRGVRNAAKKVQTHSDATPGNADPDRDQDLVYAVVDTILTKRTQPIDYETTWPDWQSIVDEYPDVDKAIALKIRDRLRYHQRLEMTETEADALLHAQARACKVPIGTLKFDTVRSRMPSEKQLRSRKISLKVAEFESKLRQLLNGYIEQENNFISIKNCDKISELVQSQKWPHLRIIATLDRGRGIASETSLKNGCVLCDYHGEVMSRKAGEAIRLKIAEVDSEASNYQFMFVHDSKRMCVDAATIPCKCHPNMETTFGRIFNHSKKPNCHVKRIVLPNGDVSLVIVAKKDITPLKELYIDYGERKDVDGHRLDFLHSGGSDT
jgi:hypothetical protein